MAGLLIPVLGTRRLADLTRELRQNAARFEAVTTAIVEDEGRRALRELKRQWPDRGKPGWLKPTGFSKSSWTFEKVGKLAWELINTANYAEYIHPPRNAVRLAESIVPATVAKMRVRIEERLRLALRGATTTLPVPGGRLGRVRL